MSKPARNEWFAPVGRTMYRAIEEGSVQARTRYAETSIQIATASKGRPKKGQERMKRTMIVATLLMAAIVVLSGPVAHVVDLPEPTAEAKNKHKKKKKKNRPKPPAFNAVQCPNSPDNNFVCDGTPGKDHLIGGPASRSPSGETDYIYGWEGNDVYNGGGGGDVLTDNSTTSNDRYLLPSTEFSLPSNISPGWTLIQDFGGSADVLDLGSYESTDFARSRFQGNPRTLRLDGPGARDIHIYDFFTTNSIDLFKFSDRTITADEIKNEFQ